MSSSLASSDVLHLDGSFGEGGGQILRTSLSLSCVFGKAFHLHNIRRGRPKPGIRPQHLASIKAAAKISEGETKGARIGSDELFFCPGKVHGGKFLFDIGEEVRSAGSTSLVFQTVFLPLAFAEQPSTVILRGGTHVPWSPPFHYLSEIFLPAVKEMNIDASACLERWGWYPAGGGTVRFEINPSDRVFPVHKKGAFGPVVISGLSASSNLPEHIPLRQKRALLKRLAAEGIDISCELIPAAPSIGQGTFVFIKATGPNSIAGFSALGARGKKAEEVADEAASLLLTFLSRDMAIEEHLADQIIPFMALAQGESSITTEKISSHLCTNIWVTEQFTGRQFKVEGLPGSPGSVTCLAQEPLRFRE